MVDQTLILANDPSATLRRVGNVLILVGVVDIVWMIHVVSSGQGYSSSFNIFAVVAGILLRRKSLRTARVVRVFAAFMLAGLLGLLIAIPIIFPTRLILTFLRTTPTSDLAVGSAVGAALVLFLWWVYRSLTTSVVEAAIGSAQLGRPRYWHQPKAGFLAGAGMMTLLAILMPLMNRSGAAERAIEQARAKFGPDHHYFVSSLGTSWSRSRGTQVRATVLAYTDSSIESVHLDWRE